MWPVLDMVNLQAKSEFRNNVVKGAARYFRSTLKSASFHRSARISLYSCYVYIYIYNFVFSIPLFITNLDKQNYVYVNLKNRDCLLLSDLTPNINVLLISFNLNVDEGMYGFKYTLGQSEKS